MTELLYGKENISWNHNCCSYSMTMVFFSLDMSGKNTMSSEYTPLCKWEKNNHWVEIVSPYTSEKLEAQWAESVSLAFHSGLRKLYTEPSMVLPTKFRFIWPSGFRGEDFRVSSHFWQILYRNTGFFAWKHRINLWYNLPKIHGLHLHCSRKRFLIMVFISKDRKLILQS